MLAGMARRPSGGDLGCWCWWPDSNGRPTDYESVALPTELHQRGGAKLYAPSLLRSGRRIAAFPALKRIAGVGRWVHSMQQTVFPIKRVRVAHAIAPFDPGSIECPQLRRTGHQRVALVDLEHDRLRRLHRVLAGNHETFGRCARFALAENLRACEHENSR